MKVGHRRVFALPPISRRDFISNSQFRSLVKHTLDNLEPQLSTNQREYLDSIMRKERTSLVSLWSVLPHVVGAYLFVEAVQRAHWQLQLEDDCCDKSADPSDESGLPIDEEGGQSPPSLADDAH